MQFSSVVGYHMNPLTCGVAKFNSELAKRLGVPFGSWRSWGENWGDFPLFSLKASEMPAVDFLSFVARVDGAYGVFWHDDGDIAVSDCAAVVMYADPSLGSPGLWCPSLLTPTKPRTVRLFSFGMAHKLQTAHYKRVQELLYRSLTPFHLRVSVGLHEGTSLDGVEQHFDALRDILGPENVTILGCLSDDAVAEELHDANYVLAFFEKGVRANNTTVHAALDAGCSVITNVDAHTPVDLGWQVTDITRLIEWPGRGSAYSWDNLIREMEALCARSQSVSA